MEPGESGKEMLIDHLPHANSILMKLVKGKAIEIQFEKKDKEEIIINFNYEACKVKYHFKYNPNRPRKLELIFNGKKFARKVGEDYQQSFEGEGKTIRIEDPLAVSIRKFLGAIERKEPPLIEKNEVLESAKLTELILAEYNKT
jgi:hypothetical protein